MYGHSPLLPFCCSPPYTSYGKKIESPALSEHIRRIVTSYAMWFNNKYGRYDHLFQDRFKSEYIDKFPVAMAYVPWQHLTNVFENLEEAFKAGTIFPELEKPFKGRRCVK